MPGTSPHPGADDRDPLTGLPGLAAARRRLDGWAAPSGNAGQTQAGKGAGIGASIGGGGVPAHGLLLSLPRLPAINLAHGAEAGDALLVRTAARLVQFAGAEFDGPWFAARPGGSTFLLFAGEPLSRERWELLAHGLAELIARPLAGTAATIRAAPRIALVRALPGEGADSLLDRLMQALALLERRGGRRLLWADGSSLRTGQGAAAQEGELAGAIERGEIEVLFQPQFALAPARPLTGAEALARWNHPRLGRIGAAALFALAERADLLAPLARCITAQALAGAARWPAALRLSLNVTSAEIAAPDWPGHLAAAIAASGFPADRLTLEVTEEALIADVAGAARVLAALAQTGIRIALDDFGAGFCNFRYLKLLPLHYLKLDRSMIDGIATDPKDLEVLRAIVAMARALGLEVIAEGIEDAAQEAAAAAEGCATMQGFLRGRPMAAEAFTRLAGERA